MKTNKSPYGKSDKERQTLYKAYQLGVAEGSKEKSELSEDEIKTLFTEDSIAVNEHTIAAFEGGDYDGRRYVSSDCDDFDAWYDYYVNGNYYAWGGDN